MNRIIRVYGIISGAVTILLMLITGIIMKSNGVNYHGYGMFIGYAGMILSFSFIFLAIDAYKKSHGSVNFKQGFKIGLWITVIASICYVIGWTIVYHTMVPDFMDQYARYAIDNMRESGATEAAITEETENMQAMAESYKNPLIFIAFTLLEIFPVGLLISLMAATIAHFRNKKQNPTFDRL
jgi:hypothetical protein